MTYMEMEDYPLAAVEFQIMRKDYPTSPFVEDALFAEGKAYLFQVDRIERDITGALEARLHFLKFSQEYPGSRYMPEVVDYMQQISDLMVRKRLGQVKVYGQLKRYQAIAIVLDDVLTEEAGSTLIPQVMWERARVAERLADPDTAADLYEKLVDRYPDGPYAGRAASALRNLDAVLPTAADEDAED
jgi:outer membrane protein assembly factor BamD (BamD/ComL family)